MIKRIKAAILLLFILMPAVIMAQQEAMYSQYMFNTMAINPAYAGSRKAISAAALLRTQWIGIEGAPKTATFTIDAPLKSNKMGLGAQIFNDKIGVTNTSGGFISYAYRLKMNENDAFLSFGLQAGLSSFKANYTDAVLTNQPQAGDQAFLDNVNRLSGNFGAGIYYNTDRFYAGLSSPQLLSRELADINRQNPGQQIHIFFTSGYVFPLGENFNLKPSFLIKGVKGAPIETDLNATLWIKDIIAIGAQYRTNADAAGLIQLQLSPQLQLGYAYDYSTTALRKYNSGSHEFMLRFEFGSTAGGTAVTTPRYF